MRAVTIMKSNRGFWNEFKIYKFVLWPCGLWPFQKRNVNQMFFYLVTTISQIFVLVLLSTEIYKACGNQADLLDYYAIFVCYVMSLIKLVCIRLHFSQMYRNCHCAWENWSKVNDANVLKIMQRYAKIAKIFSSIEMTAACCVVLLYAANPFIMPRTDASNLPVQTVCTFRNLTDWEYIFLYVAESISLLYLGFCLMGVDIFFFGIVMHLCAQLKILQIEFNTVGKLPWYSDYIRLMTVYTKKHNRLIILANDLKKAFSILLLLQFIMSIFLITSQSATFLIALKVNNKFLAFKTTQTFPILFMEIFFYCYAGQTLQYEFSNISNSIYNSRWYLLPPKLRQYYLLFAMTVGNKSFNLTAGQLVNVDMSLFIFIIKIMVSFFSFLLLIFDQL